MVALPRQDSLFGTLLTAGVVTGATGLLLRACGLVSTLVLLNSITVYEYGLWRLALGAVGAFGLFTLPGFDALVTADLGREAGKGNRALYRALFFRMSGLLVSLSAIACVLLLLGAPFITRISGIDMTYLLRILAVTIISTTFIRIYTYAFTTNLLFVHAQGVALVNAVIYLGALSYFALHGGLSVISVGISMLFASVATVVLFMPSMVALIAPLFGVAEAPYSLRRTLQEHGKWGILSGYTDTATSSLKPWLMGFFVSIEAVGLFSAAVAIFSALNGLLPVNQVLSSILPRSLSDRGQLLFMLKRSLKYTIFAYVILVAIAFTLIPVLVPVLLPRYMPALPLFLLICASFLSIPLSNQQTQILNMFRSQKFLVVAHSSARLVSVAIVLPISLLAFGVYGAAIDHIVTSMLVLLFKKRYVRDLLPELSYSVREILLLDAYDRSFIAKVVARVKSLI